MSVGDGSLGLGAITPGQAAWLAQINSNLEQLVNINSWRRTKTSGEALTAGEAVAIENSDGKMYKADHTAVPTTDDYLWNVFGVTATTVAGADESIIVVIRGPITVTAHGFPVGAPVYLSPTVPGALTSVSTSGRLIGIVEDANTIFLDCPRAWASS